MAKKRPNPTAMAEAAMEPIITFANSDRGMKTKIHTEIQGMIDTNVSRQMVERWTHVGPDKRVMPTLQNYFALIAAVEALEGEES